MDARDNVEQHQQGLVARVTGQRQSRTNDISASRLQTGGRMATPQQTQTAVNLLMAAGGLVHALPPTSDP